MREFYTRIDGKTGVDIAVDPSTGNDIGLAEEYQDDYQDNEPECECLRIDVDLLDNSFCPVHNGS